MEDNEQKVLCKRKKKKKGLCREENQWRIDST